MLLEALKDRLTKSEAVNEERKTEASSAAETKPGKWESRIYGLNTEITAVEKTLDALRKELAYAQAGLNRVRNAKTPTCRIPDTILSMIFSKCGSSFKYIAPQATFVKSICAVCHHWRTVALNTPTLWSDIVMDAGALTPRVRAYLERSKNAPLFFQLHAENVEKLWNAQHYKRWFDSLEPHLARCNIFCLFTSNHETAQKIFPLKVKMPELWQIAWEGQDAARSDSSPPETPTAINLIEDSVGAEITALDLNALHSPVQIQYDEKITSKLKHLRVREFAGTPYRDVVELVARCPSLKTLNWVNDLGEGDSAAEELTSLSSTSLQVVRFSLAQNGAPNAPLYSNMAFPALKSVVIVAGRGSSVWADPIIAVDLEAKVPRFPELMTAWLSHRVFSPAAIVDFLIAHPTVEALGSRLDWSTPGVFHMLCGPVSLSSWKEQFPKLKYFYVMKAGADSVYYPDGMDRPKECVSAMVTAITGLINAYGGYEQAKEDELLIQLNDESWGGDDADRESEYDKLKETFPDVVKLSHDENCVPNYFQPKLLMW